MYAYFSNSRLFQLAAVEEEKRQLDIQINKLVVTQEDTRIQLREQVDTEKCMMELEKAELERQLQSSQKCYVCIFKLRPGHIIPLIEDTHCVSSISLHGFATPELLCIHVGVAKSTALHLGQVNVLLSKSMSTSAINKSTYFP